MTSCTYCGGELEYIDEYDEWYCYYCEEYHEPPTYSRYRKPRYKPSTPPIPPPHPYTYRQEHSPPVSRSYRRNRTYYDPYDDPYDDYEQQYEEFMPSAKQRDYYGDYYAPPKRPVNKGLIRGIIIVIFIVVGLVLASFVILEYSKDDDNKNNEEVTMSVSDLEDDTKTVNREDYQGYDYYYTVDFESLDSGDTLNLKDTITEIDYYYYNDVTTIELNYNMDFDFKGDISDNFNEGDRVIISLHIKYITYESEVMGYILHFEGEVIEETWYDPMDESGYEPLPPSKIKLA